MVAVVNAEPEATAPQAIAAWRDGLRSTYGDDDIVAFGAALNYLRAKTGAAIGADGERLVDRDVHATAQHLGDPLLKAGIPACSIGVRLPYQLRLFRKSCG
ncbi:MAG: hypothetical protein ABI474_10855 [Actinomycetota bacterium]